MQGMYMVAIFKQLKELGVSWPNSVKIQLQEQQVPLGSNMDPLPFSDSASGLATR